MCIVSNWVRIITCALMPSWLGIRHPHLSSGACGLSFILIHLPLTRISANFPFVRSHSFYYDYINSFVSRKCSNFYLTMALNIRNLSPTIITLKGIERFEDPNSKQSRAIFPFGFRNDTSPAPSAPKLSEHAQSFNHEELNISLSPFESYTLHPKKLPNDIKNPLSTTAIRLTISTQNEQGHRLDINPTHTQKTSRPFTPLATNPSTTYTGLYLPSLPIPHLAVHTNNSISLPTWMSQLPSTLPLSALSIPGTHNSHTTYRALPSVRCQLHPLSTQLENGIRFLDIRVQPVHATDISKKDLYLVHGAFPVSLTGPKYLAPLLETCYAFLRANPRESILISLKREGIGSSTDPHLAQILETHYITPNAEFWYTEPKMPYLGAARGKLVLLRRYHTSSDSAPTPTSISTNIGIDATPWPYNPANALLPTPSPLALQDWCDVLSPTQIPQKQIYIHEHLARAAETTAFVPGVNTDATNPVPPAPLHLNFCSGSNFFNVGCWPERIAGIVNRGVEEWLCGKHHLEEDNEGDSSIQVGESKIRRKKDVGDGGTGVLIMDCVGEGGDWDLVRLVVGMNMGVLARMKGEEEVNH